MNFSLLKTHKLCLKYCDLILVLKIINTGVPHSFDNITHNPVSSRNCSTVLITAGVLPIARVQSAYRRANIMDLGCQVSEKNIYNNYISKNTQKT